MTRFFCVESIDFCEPFNHKKMMNTKLVGFFSGEKEDVSFFGSFRKRDGRHRDTQKKEMEAAAKEEDVSLSSSLAEVMTFE